MTLNVFLQASWVTAILCIFSKLLLSVSCNILQHSAISLKCTINRFLLWGYVSCWLTCSCILISYFSSSFLSSSLYVFCCRSSVLTIEIGSSPLHSFSYLTTSSSVLYITASFSIKLFSIDHTLEPWFRDFDRPWGLAKYKLIWHLFGCFTYLSIHGVYKSKYYFV